MPMRSRTRGFRSLPCCSPISREEPSRWRNRRPRYTVSVPLPSVHRPAGAWANFARMPVMPAYIAEAYSTARRVRLTMFGKKGTRMG